MAELSLAGSMVALVTPFRDGAVDAEALAILCERQETRGTSAIVLCGSTGEAASMRPVEHATVLRTAVSAAKGVAVVAGCGGPCTEIAADLAATAAREGAAAVLCAPPPYVRPTQDGIIAHVRAVSAASGLPVLLYDVPGRTGVGVHDETVARLFESGHIVGIKDATSDLARPPRLRALCGPGLAQLSGDDATAAAYRAAGGHGCISVTANLVPALCHLMHRAWDAEDLRTFARVRDQLAPLSDALFLESNPIPVKAALTMLGLVSGELRLPLTRASADTCDRLADLLAALTALEDQVAPRTCPAWLG